MAVHCRSDDAEAVRRAVKALAAVAWQNGVGGGVKDSTFFKGEGKGFSIQNTCGMFFFQTQELKGSEEFDFH